MALVKCPRCELNYMNEGEKMCSVCRREVRGESEQEEMIELCSECGENPVVPGQELCAYCLKELARHNSEPNDDAVPRQSANIEIDSVSTMDEIELDIVDDAMASEFGAEDEFKDNDEDEEEEAAESDILSTDALADDEAAEDEDDDMDDDE